MLNLSGWHDDAYGPDGATTNFAALVKPRGGAARTRLLVGPWQHGVEETQTGVAGDRDFGKEAAIDYDQVILRWIDGTFAASTTASIVRSPFAFSCSATTAGATPTGGRSRARRRPRSTSMVGDGSPRPRRRRPRRFHSCRTPRSCGRGPFDAAAGAHDYRALAGRAGVLTFDSEPLTADTEIVGRITAEVYVSSDARDLDLWVRLYDVAPDGTAWNLMSPGGDVVRELPRRRPRRELSRPAKTYLLRVPDLITANTFKRGHRIRVQISGAFSPNLSEEPPDRRARDGVGRVAAGANHRAPRRAHPVANRAPRRAARIGATGSRRARQSRNSVSLADCGRGCRGEGRRRAGIGTVCCASELGRCQRISRQLLAVT